MLKYHIQTIEVGSGGTTSVNFNNIPQDYDDLLLEVSARSGYNGYGQDLSIKFNSNSANYSARRLYGNGQATGSDTGSSTQFSPAAPITGATSTAGTFGNSVIYISNYASSSSKAISSKGVGESNATNAVQAIAAGLWNDTSAITSIQCIDNSTLQQYSTFSLYGIKHGVDGVVEAAADGGAITQSGGYTIHTFTSSGTFVTNRDMDVEYVVVAGGGGASQGAGGAGGYRSSVSGESSGGGASAENPIRLTAGNSYQVIVGAGGAAEGGGNPPVSGNPSSFAGILSVGGGSSAFTFIAQDGGSGGSASGNSTGAFQIGGSGVTGQGYDGGDGPDNSGTGYRAAGGGGGAGAPGGTGIAGSSGPAGDGGDGVQSSITGSAVYRAGGGGGAGLNGPSAGSGGLGGGGNGVSTGNGQNGTAYTGGGGGGGNDGGNGGSGVVIIRYPTPA